MVLKGHPSDRTFDERGSRLRGSAQGAVGVVPCADPRTMLRPSCSVHLYCSSDGGILGHSLARPFAGGGTSQLFLQTDRHYTLFVSYLVRIIQREIRANA
jgi:hypothetical protein